MISQPPPDVEIEIFARQRAKKCGFANSLQGQGRADQERTGVFTYYSSAFLFILSVS
jgi:hypothetical protein